MRRGYRAAFAMRSYPYLDTPVAELVAQGWEMWLYCACGHHALMTTAVFERWPGSSFHRLVAKARCSRCGVLGDVPEVRVSVKAAGRSLAGPFWREVPAPPCCPAGARNLH